TSLHWCAIRPSVRKNHGLDPNSRFNSDIELSKDKAPIVEKAAGLAKNYARVPNFRRIQSVEARSGTKKN
ncbi:MAG: hypothetical protein ACR2FJ_06855, partial [Qipengyuania sp.]